MPASQLDGLPHAGIQHPRVRQFLDVKHARSRCAPTALALEGLWAVGHGALASLRFESAFVCRALLRGDGALDVLESLRAAGTPVLEVSEHVLRRMADRDGPDGLAAVAHLPVRTLADVEAVGGAGPPRVVVADGFELAGNLGTLVRCADGAGAAGVVATDRRVRLTHPLVVKASMATVFTVPVVDAGREEAAAWLRRRGFRMIAADPAARLSYRDAGYAGPVAVVLGSERHGLDPFWREAADVLVSIPMLGVADSLNVALAGALLLYEALHGQQPARPGYQSPARW